MQRNPRVHLIFWGPKWGSDPGGVEVALSHLFTSLPGSPWMRVLAEYGGPHGSVGDQVTLSGAWVDDRVPPPIHGLDQAAGEVLRAMERNAWRAGPNDQFFVVLQPGATFDPTVLNYCALHSVGTKSGGGSFYYALIAFPSHGCVTSTSPSGGNRVADAVTWLAAHEFSEIATDPEQTAWGAFGSAPHGETEVADLCQAEGGYRFDGIWIPELWDRIHGWCSGGIRTSDGA